MSAAVRVPLSEQPSACASEYQYSPLELAEEWHVSDDYIRRMFEHEPGVLIYQIPNRTSKRRQMRIPESVAQRVKLRNTVK
jgi:hypothetical protein